MTMTSVASDQTLFPARLRDVATIHTMITNAIEETPHYSTAFKAFERARMNKAFLSNLIDTDPDYVMLVRDRNAVVAGLMISGPEYGALFLYWAYLKPEFRVGTLAMRSMRNYVSHWDNNRFHKISALVKPENRAPRMLMKRNGYREITLLENHLFGEDYILCERKLTKTIEGYDSGLSFGMKKRMKLAVKSVLD
jgi:RimJ/RimL family protein N-acetyltransferase